MKSYYVIKITRSEKSLFKGESYVGTTGGLDHDGFYYSFADIDKAVTFPTVSEAENCLIKYKDDLFNRNALTHLYIQSIEIIHIVCIEEQMDIFYNLDELKELERKRQLY